MHSSIVITSLLAALAVASPVHQGLHKRAIVYDIVTDIVTVTVTAGDLPETVNVQKTVYVNPVPAPTTTSKAKPKKPSTKARRPRPTTTSIPPPPPPPPPAPTTTTTPPPPPPPPSTTSEAPAPVYTPAPAPEPEKVAAPAKKIVEAAPTSAPSTAPPSSSGNKVKDAILNFHNEKRAIHHVGSVTWDDSLAADAEKLAQSCTNEHAMFVFSDLVAFNLANVFIVGVAMVKTLLLLLSRHQTPLTASLIRVS